MTSEVHADLGPIQGAVDAALGRLTQADAVARVWRRDGTLWAANPDVARAVEHRLGWLDAPHHGLDDLATLLEFREAHRDAARVVLLGMGGSSLAPEVMAEALAGSELPLTVLDSTAPDAIRGALSGGLDGTVVIVSSKSGTTIETRTLAAAFRERAQHATLATFVAITDPDSPLAREPGYSRVFLNAPDIGGRYSALSYFGLVPAALVGVDVERLLRTTLLMVEACRQPAGRGREDHPGAWLAAAMAGAAAEGRDKVTLVLSPALAALGAWIEQLLAESTGKQGRGLIPIDGEVLASPGRYGADRLFVRVALRSDGDETAGDALRRLAQAGHPVVQIILDDPYELGAEFFRWEMATALAGFLLGINPFDEPNVQQAKDLTRVVLDEYVRRGRFEEEAEGEALDAFLHSVEPPEYVGLLAFVARTPRREQALALMRRRLHETFRVATTRGFGPRYLHSTGQLFKGGPATGRFVIITAESRGDVPIPGEAYTFGVLLRAQALGDLRALRQEGRRALRVHLEDADAGLDALADRLEAAIFRAGD